jgi:hypothetical protein
LIQEYFSAERANPTGARLQRWRALGGTDKAASFRGSLRAALQSKDRQHPEGLHKISERFYDVRRRHDLARLFAIVSSF